MSLREKLLGIGYNRDVEISEGKMGKVREEKEDVDRKSLAFLEHRNEPTYRDDRSSKSIELKYYRKRGYRADFVAELEHYNPDSKPLGHVIIDFPLWIWKNRIKNRGPKEK
jgi:hypothetical protein